MSFSAPADRDLRPVRFPVPANMKVQLWVGLSLALLVAAYWPSVEYRLDDPFIVFHNARSLISGTDPLYGTSPLVGSTSLVHLLLVAMLGQVLAYPNAALVICVASTAAYACGLRRWGWWSVLIGLLAGSIPLQLFNGLETSLALAAIVWAINWADDWRLAPLAAILPFIRPELGLLSALLVCRRLVRNQDWRLVIVTGAIALPLAAYQWSQTGSILPNTGAAKIAFAGPQGGPFAGFLIEGASALRWFMLPLLLAAPLLARAELGRWLLAFLVGWLTIAASTFPTGFFGHEGRYWAVAVPIVLYGLRGIALHLMVAISAFSAPWLLFTTPGYGNPWPRMVEAAKQLPEGSTVMIHDAGVIAYERPRLHLVDVVGLKTPRSTEIHKQFGSRDRDWSKALDQIARESHADYVIVLQKPLWRCIRVNLIAMDWNLEPVFNDPNGFAIYHLSAPAKPRTSHLPFRC